MSWLSTLKIYMLSRKFESVANKKRYEHFRYRPAFAPVAIFKILVLGQILL